jgi:hypothetical protein
MKKINYFSIFLLSCVLISFQLVTPSFAGEKGYRYWGYFQSPNGLAPWVSAMTGPTTIVPDGSVEGWVFTFSSDAIVDAQAPRLTPNFGKLCATTKFAGENKKRIGVVVDFGRAVLRPRGETSPKNIATCVTVDKSATGFDVLQAVVKIRASSSGFVCALSGYPAKECGAEISTPPSLLSKPKK